MFGAETSTVARDRHRWRELNLPPYSSCEKKETDNGTRISVSVYDDVLNNRCWPLISYPVLATGYEVFRYETDSLEKTTKTVK